MSFQKLDDLCRRLDALDHALAILGADEATHMAPGGGEARAEAMAVLAGMHHRQATAPEIADWIDAAEREPLSEDQRAALREFRRVHTNLTCLPAEFVERQTRTRMRCEQLWRELRPRNDWAGFLPALDAVVELTREEAQRRAQVLKLDPYDALIEQYDPGGRTADIAPLFFVHKFDYVFHYAAVVGVQRTLENPLMVLDDIKGIENVLKVLRFDIIWRLRYNDHPGTRPFALRAKIVINF